MVRQLNALRTSELSGTPLAFVINTGDATDNRQHNELRWVIDILDGGAVTPTSGGPRYQGVQQANGLPYYYHPDSPAIDDYGRLRDFPAYPGILSSGEQGFSAAGLEVPWYAVLGNHDGLVQGTLPALEAFERLATGPVKIVAFPFGRERRARFTRDLLRGDPTAWRELSRWVETHQKGVAVLVTPDRRRRLVSHQEWIGEHFETRGEPVGHGFTRENLDTDAGYYTFDPSPEVHCVVLDTVNPAAGANGNIDAAQFEWLDADLTANAGKITLVFAHHTIATMDNALARPNDPSPPRLGADLEGLLRTHPNVVALVNGHTHRNAVIPHSTDDGIHGGFWEINTAAHIDWPEQSRLIEVFDNADGTLSIFGTIVDHMAAPDEAGSLTPSGLAAISRELAYNDPQHAPAAGAGTPLDRNVELIVASPLAP
jgi:metallophosphoesterase (TIGR03767 family)